MKLTRLIILLALCGTSALGASAQVTVGAERTELYLDSLRGRRVALYTNQTGRIGDRATVDVLLDSGVNVVTLFSPEHGIRGTADAGESVSSGRDPSTGIPIVSLFGSGAAPSRPAIADADIIVTDIQDVGLRYYTYYITMLELMNEVARQGKPFMVLDRPNPLGMTVDGPVLDMRYASGVGRLPIPTVHGMTLGELARMIIGEGWLKDGRTLALTVIPCGGYTHATRYALPVPPSPNLPNMKAVYLYPSLCYFEATPVSLGRGTDLPFQCYGHPDMADSAHVFTFTPTSRPGARKPPQMGRKCYGVDLSTVPDDTLISRGIDLTYLIDAYRTLGLGDGFFTKFFENLMGTDRVRRMIIDGASADSIRATWAPDVQAFLEQRRPYLLYPEN